MRQTKSSANKRTVSCSYIIKLYNNGMRVVDIMDQKTDNLEAPSRKQVSLLLENVFWSYKCRTCKISYSLHETWQWHGITEFQIAVTKALIGRYSNHNRSFPINMPSKQKSHVISMPREVPAHMPEFQEKQMRCYYCKNKGSDQKTFIRTCGLYLCLTKGRNCL